MDFGVDANLVQQAHLGNRPIKLTESFMMLPAGSVSGYYFAHPGSRYFAIDRITRPGGRLRRPQELEAQRGREVAGPRAGV